MKYLIVGLGNIGADYEGTRHNIGFDVVDELARLHDVSFELQKQAYYTELKVKGRTLHVIKPTTYMNLSGKAVRYYMDLHKIKPENILVVVDDIAIDFGRLRLRAKGSDAGHNGIKNITELLGHNKYPRLRFGIGGNFHRGQQIKFVLGKWSPNEQKQLPELIDTSVKAIESFVSIGLQHTMNQFNN